MRKLAYVTSNDGKARDAAQTLGIDIERVSMSLDEIQSLDLRVIIEHKARQAYKKLRRAVIVDDTSFEIDQWNGFPGPFTAWLDKTIGYKKLPSLLAKKDRRARWTTMLGYFDGKTFETFSSTEEGSVATNARGSDGWGFDLIFVPKGQQKTTAERGFALKQKSSSRVNALRKLKRFLNARA